MLTTREFDQWRNDSLLLWLDNSLTRQDWHPPVLWSGALQPGHARCEGGHGPQRLIPGKKYVKIPAKLEIPNHFFQQVGEGGGGTIPPTLPS